MQFPTIPNPKKAVAAFTRLPAKRKVTAVGSAAAAAAVLAAVGVQATAGAGSATAAGNATGFTVSTGQHLKSDVQSGVQTTDLGTHTTVHSASPQAMALTGSVEKPAPAAKKVAAPKKATTVKKAATVKKATSAKKAKSTATHHATASHASKPAAKRAAKAVTYPNNLDGWIRQSLAIMHAKGIPGTYEGIHRNIIRESSGNPQAINLWDINARNGIPSKGLLQVIDPTFQRFHVAGTSWNIYNPVANITAACNYAADRYGSMDNVNSAY
ncbi:transglycosylase SLT domain-containing protein [Actinacidiphila yeochonensis]|uniref:transglycosylase SLT domain-containing protein n=1 Tax=Actinacidiphila yeochonensis TaxID=89050 RepID=UPI000561C9AE|nr:transglycosylase SLT domain-containing protein [Actinacidiphila yeochonensis]